MTITTEEFVANFHSLSGITIGERRKNLFLLLKKAHESLDFTFIQPKTPLEESFRVETLIYFKKVPELIEVLKSENPILIEKVLKVSSWFLEQILRNRNEKVLVEELFPCLSFNAKVKFLNKLSLHLKNTQQADAIFEAIYGKYGLYLASKLLPCCSDGLIMRCVKSVRIEVTPRQLLMILMKHPQLTESILEALAQFQDERDFGCKYKNVFKHLIKTDSVLFLKIYKKYQPSFHIGWRATDRVVLTNKQNVIKNAQQFHKFLHKKQIIKSFSQDFSKFYLNMFPSSPSRFENNLKFYIELMDGLPSNASKLDLLSSTFRRSYDTQLWEHSLCIKAGLLELMTLDERDTWMQTNHRPSNISEEVWACLKRTHLSIPELKQKISLTSSKQERAELVGCLVETCRINNDRAALTAVCKYVLANHRNDDNSVLMCFLTTLKECFNLDSLNEEQWKYINEITQLFIARNLIPFYYHEWVVAYVHYRLVNQLSVKQQLMDAFKKMNLRDGGRSYFLEAKYQKQILIAFGEVMPELYKEDELKNGHIEFLYSLVQYNQKNPKDEIALLSYSDAISSLKKSLENKDYNYMASLVAVCIFKTKMSLNERKYWLDLLCSSKNFCSDMSNAEWLIRHEPNLVATCADSLVNLILELWYTILHPFFWKCCRNYSHLEIPQKIIAVCMQTINAEGESESRKKNAVNALSYLMQPAEFLNFINPYYPSDMKIDPNSEENQETYKLQQAITASLKNVIPPSVTLESVLNFSKGDYLKFIQRSLHSVCLNVPENKLPPLFNGLVNCAVSVRKHVIHHSFKVLDKVEIYRMLTKLMQTERNSSIRKILLKATFNFFGKNPDEYVWNLVKENAKAVDINDSEAFEILMEIKKIPLPYLSQYVVFTWEILEALPNPAESVVVGKGQLLDAVSSNVVPALSNEFCWRIIEKYLFKSKELPDFQKKIYNFTCKYILYSSTELQQEERLNIVFIFLKDYIKSTVCCNFVKEFCSFFLDKKSSARKILIKFTELWNSMLQPHEAFEEYLHLQFTLLYINCTTLQVAEKLAELCDSLLSIYGFAASSIFGTTLNFFVSHYIETDEMMEMKQLTLIENIIKTTNSPHCLVMIITLLPQDIPTIAENKTTYNGIVNSLSQCTNSAVQLALSNYLYKISDNFNTNVLNTGMYERNAQTSKRQRGFASHLHYVETYSSKYRNYIYL